MQLKSVSVLTETKNRQEHKTWVIVWVNDWYHANYRVALDGGRVDCWDLKESEQCWPILTIVMRSFQNIYVLAPNAAVASPANVCLERFFFCLFLRTCHCTAEQSILEQKSHREKRDKIPGGSLDTITLDTVECQSVPRPPTFTQNWKSTQLHPWKSKMDPAALI